MEGKPVSRTALFSAYARGYHAERHNPKIFDDFLAFHMLSEGERALYERKITDAFPDRADALEWYMQSLTNLAMTVSRSRYTEDSLEMAVEQGVRQYVILGAGLDTFAFRHPRLLDSLQVFEVDHHDTQAYKRQRITELGWRQPEHLHLLPADFKKDNLDTVLKGSPYDPEALTFFSWLGVTQYLPRDTVFAMLSMIASIAPKGSSLIFDYYDADAFDPEKVAPSMKMWKQIAEKLGEPFITGFDPSALGTDLLELGWRIHENLSPSEIEERYFQERTDGYHAAVHTHYAWAGVD